MGVDTNEIIASADMLLKTEAIRPADAFNAEILSSGINQMVDEAQLDEPVTTIAMQPSL